MLAAGVDKVKEEEEEVVVEVDVEPEEMDDGTVKEEVEAKVVVETPAGGGVEPVAQGDDGVQGCGGHPRLAMGPGRPGWPPPPKPEHPPPCRPGESSLDSPVFVQRVHHRVGGGGTVGMEGQGGGSTWTSPCA